MQTSKIVTTNQPGIHRNLAKLVQKHINSADQSPIRQHNQQAFALLIQQIKQVAPKRLILDSCCGVGQSSIYLAERNPQALVVGVDQSAHRLGKKKGRIPDNCLFLRANCEDIWRLSIAEGLRFDSHYILYPNPWPKASQLARRWHGHPVFPLLPALSNYLEVRSNWLLYIQEFDFAWFLLTGQKGAINTVGSNQNITLFETKYLRSGQHCYQWRVGALQTL